MQSFYASFSSMRYSCCLCDFMQTPLVMCTFFAAEGFPLRVVGSGVKMLDFELLVLSCNSSGWLACGIGSAYNGWGLWSGWNGGASWLGEGEFLLEEGAFSIGCFVLQFSWAHFWRFLWCFVVFGQWLIIIYFLQRQHYFNTDCLLLFFLHWWLLFCLL